MFSPDLDEENYESKHPRWSVQKQQPPAYLWAKHFSLPESKRNPLYTKLFVRQLSLFRVYYPFLDKTQIMGKVYKKFGIPSVCGEIAKDFLQNFGKKLKRIRSKAGRSSVKKFSHCYVPQIHIETVKEKTFDSVKNSWKLEKIYDNVEDFQLYYSPYISKPRQTTPRKSPTSVKEAIGNNKKLLNQFLIFEDMLDVNNAVIKKEVSSATKKNTGALNKERYLMDGIQCDTTKELTRKDELRQKGGFNAIHHTIMKSSLRTDSSKKTSSVKKRVQFTNIDIFHSADSDSECNNEELARPLEDSERGGSVPISELKGSMITENNIPDVMTTKNIITVKAIVHQADVDDTHSSIKSASLKNSPCRSERICKNSKTSQNLESIRVCSDIGYESDIEYASTISLSDEECDGNVAELKLKKKSAEVLNDCDVNEELLNDLRKPFKNISEENEIICDGSVLMNNVNVENLGCLAAGKNKLSDHVINTVDFDYTVNKRNSKKTENIFFDSSINSVLLSSKRDFDDELSEKVHLDDNTLKDDKLNTSSPAMIKSSGNDAKMNKLFTPNKQPESSINIESFSEELTPESLIVDKNKKESIKLSALEMIQDFLVLNEKPDKNIDEVLSATIIDHKHGTGVSSNNITNIDHQTSEILSNSFDSEMSDEEIQTSQPTILTKSYGHRTTCPDTLGDNSLRSIENLTNVCQNYEVTTKLDGFESGVELRKDSIRKKSEIFNDSNKENMYDENIKTLLPRSARRTLNFDGLSDSSLCSSDVPQSRSRIVVDHDSDSDMSFTCGRDCTDTFSKLSSTNILGREDNKAVFKGVEKFISENSIESCTKLETTSSIQKSQRYEANRVDVCSFEQDLMTCTQDKNNNDTCINNQDGGKTMTDLLTHSSIETCTTKDIDEILPLTCYYENSLNGSYLLTGNEYDKNIQRSLSPGMYGKYYSSPKTDAVTQNNENLNIEIEEPMSPLQKESSCNIPIVSEQHPSESEEIYRKNYETISHTVNSELHEFNSRYMSAANESTQNSLNRKSEIAKSETAGTLPSNERLIDENSNSGCGDIIAPTPLKDKALSSQANVFKNYQDSVNENFENKVPESNQLSLVSSIVDELIAGSNKNSKSDGEEMLPLSQPQLREEQQLHTQGKNNSKSSSEEILPSSQPGLQDKQSLPTTVFVKDSIKKNSGTGVKQNQKFVRKRTFQNEMLFDEIEPSDIDNFGIDERQDSTLNDFESSKMLSLNKVKSNYSEENNVTSSSSGKIISSIIMKGKGSLSISAHKSGSLSSDISLNNSTINEKFENRVSKRRFQDESLEEENHNISHTRNRSQTQNRVDEIEPRLKSDDGLFLKKEHIKRGALMLNNGQNENTTINSLETGDEIKQSVGYEKTKKFTNIVASYSGNETETKTNSGFGVSLNENSFCCEKETTLQSVSAQRTQIQDDKKILHIFDNESVPKNNEKVIVKTVLDEQICEPHESSIRRSVMESIDPNNNSGNILLNVFLEDSTYYNQVRISKVRTDEADLAEFHDEENYSILDRSDNILLDGNVNKATSLKINKNDTTWIKEAVIDPNIFPTEQNDVSSCKDNNNNESFLDIVPDDSSQSERSQISHEKQEIGNPSDERFCDYNIKSDLLKPKLKKEEKSSVLKKDNPKCMMVGNQVKPSNVVTEVVNTDYSSSKKQQSSIKNRESLDVSPILVSEENSFVEDKGDNNNNRNDKKDKFTARNVLVTWVKEAVIDPTATTQSDEMYKKPDVLMYRDSEIHDTNDDESFLDIISGDSSQPAIGSDKKTKIEDGKNVSTNFKNSCKAGITEEKTSLSRKENVSSWRREAVIDPDNTKQKKEVANSLGDVDLLDVTRSDQSDENGDCGKVSNIVKKRTKLKDFNRTIEVEEFPASSKLMNVHKLRRIDYPIEKFGQSSRRDSTVIGGDLSVLKSQRKVLSPKRLLLDNSTPKTFQRSVNATNENVSLTEGTVVKPQGKEFVIENSESALKKKGKNIDCPLEIKKSKMNEKFDCSVKNEKLITSKYFEKNGQSPKKLLNKGLTGFTRQSSCDTVMKMLPKPVTMSPGTSEPVKKQKKTETVIDVTDKFLSEELSPDVILSAESESSGDLNSLKRKVTESCESVLDDNFKKAKSDQDQFKCFSNMKELNSDDIDKSLSSDDFMPFLTYDDDMSGDLSSGHLKEGTKINENLNLNTSGASDQVLLKSMRSIHDNIVSEDDSIASSVYSNTRGIVLKDVTLGGIHSNKKEAAKALMLNDTLNTTKQTESDETIGSFIQLKKDECAKWFSNKQISKYNLFGQKTKESSFELNVSKNDTTLSPPSRIGDLSLSSKSAFKNLNENIVDENPSLNDIFKDINVDFDNIGQSGDILVTSDPAVASKKIENSSVSSTSSENHLSDENQNNTSDLMMSPVSHGIGTPSSMTSSECHTGRFNDEMSPISNWAVTKSMSPPDFHPDNFYD